MTPVIEIFDEGNLKRYERFSSRLPRFLEAFPIRDGWRHIHEVVDASSMVPQLTALHIAALSAGKNPVEIGLPPLPRGQVFTARLINPQGVEVASGSAVSMSMDLFSPRMGTDFNGRESFFPRKDFESGETAAFQRLLAAVGFGGEMFDVDEDNTIKGMGTRTREPSQAASAATVSPIRPAPVLDLVPAATLDEVPASSIETQGLPDPMNPLAALAGIHQYDDVFDEPTSSDVVSQHKAGIVVDPVVDSTDPVLADVGVAQQEVVLAGQVAQVSSSPTMGAGGARGPSDKQRLAALSRQIIVLARQAGVTGQPVTTIEEANAELDRLSALLSR